MSCAESSVIVEQTKELTNLDKENSIAASRLLFNCKKCHFSSAESMRPCNKAWSAKYVEDLICVFQSKHRRQQITIVSKCENNILEKKATLIYGVIRKEADLCHAVRDPVTEMICSYRGYKVSPKK